MYSLIHGLVKYFHIQPMIVGAGMKTGVNLLMDNPREMGADRIVKLVAAYEIYGGPAMVIDYSTATTYDVINEKGVFVTGITAPGIQICAEALTVCTAQLPNVEIRKPKSIIVKNTIGSLQAGIVYGHIGETKYIIEQVKEELGLPELKVIATGGMAKIMESNGPLFDVIDPLLTLKGLRIVTRKIKKLRRRKIRSENRQCHVGQQRIFRPHGGDHRQTFQDFMQRDGLRSCLFGNGQRQGDLL